MIKLRRFLCSVEFIKSFTNTSVNRHKSLFKLRNCVCISNAPLINFHKSFHTNTPSNGKKKEVDHSEAILLKFSQFEEAETKDKKTFIELINLYEANFPGRQNCVDFIRIALGHMKEFGVNKDLECYKRLINIMPKGPFVVSNPFLGMFFLHSRQVFVGLRLLDIMEKNGVVPDAHLGEILLSIYGRYSHPCKKYFRMRYWSTKLKNKSPWPVPHTPPSDPFLLAKMAIEKMTSVDPETQISIFNTEEVADSVDKTWIVSGQSIAQRELLNKHPSDVPVVVEGGDIMWIRDKFVCYFILKADGEPIPFPTPSDLNDFYSMQSPYFNPNYTEEPKLSVHEQDDGIIYALCATGTSTKDSLLSWIRLLQKNGNPVLENLPVLFRFIESEKTPVPFSDALVKSEKTVPS